LKEIQVSLKFDKKAGVSDEDFFVYVTISRRRVLGVRNISDKICGGNQNTFSVQ
jgi:hypothetical protein